MRIAKFIDQDGNIHYGTDINEGLATCLKGDILYKLERTEDKAEIYGFLSPIEPAAILCIGLNYRAHASEAGMKTPEYPVVFMKNPASVIGHKKHIILPASCRNPLQVDFEVELAVVIGKKAKNVKASNALDYVFGYTIANDVSARVWQLQAGGNQWVRGKSFDTFCQLGPEIVTSDEIANPDNLDIKCVLNGEVMQQGNTSDMIFSVSKLIEFLSEDTTLLPGTVILTGTPSGVGFTRNPPVFLKPGDHLELTIEKLGTLENTAL